MVALMIFVAVLGAAAVAWACPTQLPNVTRMEFVGEQIVSSDCWFRAPPVNAMKIWHFVQKNYEINEYSRTQDCWGQIHETRIRTIRTEYFRCWRPTATSCVGSKDWQPSPICS